MGRTEKINVTATDSLSVKDKIEEYQQAAFYMQYKQQLQQLEQGSGVKMIPQDQFVAEDKQELDLWMAQYQRLPEEILYETGVNDVLQANGFFDVNKEKMLHDSAEVGLVSTRTWMDDSGVIHVDWIKPENHFYSYSEYTDLHDCTWMGDVFAMKISDLRRRFGQQFGGKLSEEDIWNIAQTAKEYQLYDKLRWLVEWNVAILRPYDEWNVDVVRFEVKTIDADPYTLVTTKKNKSTFFKKGAPQKPSETEEFVQDRNVVIYEGLYIRNPETMLYWGLKENMIRPQDPKERGDALFSYATYMYQNQDMKNVAVPEKIQEPVEQMILARYKMQQLVMKMKPIGTAINWDAVQNIDYGLGDKNQDIDQRKLYEQTGDIYFRERDAEGNPIGVPFTELKNSGFLEQLRGLILIYDKHYQILKDELGEDPSIAISATKPRVAEGNIQTAMQSADDGTDYMYDAYLYTMEMTAKRVSCLLHTSVTFGADAYRHIMNEDNIKGRNFQTKIQMLPNEVEIAKLEQMMNNAIQANPDFVMYCDTFKVMRMAREDVKMAEVYFRQCQKKMIQGQQQMQQQNQQYTAQAQQASNQQTAQNTAQLEAAKHQMKIQQDQELSKAAKEQIMLQGVMDWIKMGVAPMTPQASQVMQEVLTNVGLPLFAENEGNKQAITQTLQQAQGMQQAQPQLPQGQPQQQASADQSQPPQQ